MKNIEEYLKRSLIQGAFLSFVTVAIFMMIFIYSKNDSDNYMLIDNPYMDTNEMNLSQFSIEFDYQGNLDPLIFDHQQILEVRLYDNGFIRIYLDQSTANDIWIKSYVGFGWIYTPRDDDSDV